MVKTILLMRHAEAESGSAAGQDFDRGLVDNGREMARQTAACLTQLGLQICRIVASSSRRTQQTAEIVAAELTRDNVHPEIPLVLTERLYHASAETIARSIRDNACDEDQAILMIGHNPGLAGLICHWAGQSLHILPATLTIFQCQESSWANVRFDSADSMTYRAMLQEGDVVWKAASFGSPESP